MALLPVEAFLLATAARCCGARASVRPAWGASRRSAAAGAAPTASTMSAHHTSRSYRSTRTTCHPATRREIRRAGATASRRRTAWPSATARRIAPPAPRSAARSTGTVRPIAAAKTSIVVDGLRREHEHQHHQRARCVDQRQAAISLRQRPAWYPMASPRSRLPTMLNSPITAERPRANLGRQLAGSPPRRAGAWR